eukprot:1745113-Heterocapsa_arctica.AAC.1
MVSTDDVWLRLCEATANYEACLQDDVAFGMGRSEIINITQAAAYLSRPVTCLFLPYIPLVCGWLSSHAGQSPFTCALPSPLLEFMVFAIVPKANLRLRSRVRRGRGAPRARHG